MAFARTLEGPISKTEAERLVTNHKNTCNLTKDVIYIYFTFTGLERFIANMKALDPGANGLRIYMGRHAPEALGTMKDRQTVVLAATRFDQDAQCTVEMLEDGNDETDPPYFDFGTLCPPDCNCACDADDSIGRRVYGNLMCP